MTGPLNDGLGVTQEPDPIPLRRRDVTPEERTAMAVAKAYGVTQVDVAKHFGYDPRTVRRALQSISDEERRLVGTIAAQELSGLHAAVARRATLALLERDMNRLQLDAEGNEIEGRYAVNEVTLNILAGTATDKINDLRSPAGMGNEKDATPLNPVAGFLRNQEELAKVTRQLPAGVKLRIEATQSLEVSGEESSDDSSPAAVDASFSVD